MLSVFLSGRKGSLFFAHIYRGGLFLCPRAWHSLCNNVMGAGRLSAVVPIWQTVEEWFANAILFRLALF